jgi:hypothetical protein
MKIGASVRLAIIVVTFGGFLFGSFLVDAKPPVGGLVLYYPLVEAKPNQIKDLSVQHNQGQPVAIMVSNSPSLVSMQQTRQLTISVWIKPNSIPKEFPVVIDMGGNQLPSAYGGYELDLNWNGDNDLAFVSGPSAVVTGNANGRWINNHLGEWIYVAFTLDDATKTAKFYVNGQPTNDEVDWGTYFNSTTPLNFGVSNNLYIGKPDPAHNSNRSCFDGSMRELMIFNRALTAVEIQSLFESTHLDGSRI